MPKKALARPRPSVQYAALWALWLLVLSAPGLAGEGAGGFSDSPAAGAGQPGGMPAYQQFLLSIGPAGNIYFAYFTGFAIGAATGAAVVHGVARLRRANRKEGR